MNDKYKKPLWPKEIIISSVDRYTHKHGGGLWRISWVDFDDNSICLVEVCDDNPKEWMLAGQDLLDSYIKVS